MFAFIRNNRRKFTIGGIVAALGLTGIGVAIAAILLTTNVTGQATVNTVATSDSVSVAATAASGSRLDCSDVAVTNDFKTLTFNPKLTKPVGGPNASNVPVPGGNCTITLTVKNTGDDTITVDPSSALNQFPTGWTVSNFSGTALSPIAPGATATLTATVTATEAAVAGPISGKIVYSD